MTVARGKKNMNRAPRYYWVFCNALVILGCTLINCPAQPLGSRLKRVYIRPISRFMYSAVFI